MAQETIDNDVIVARASFALTGSATAPSALDTELKFSLNYILRDMVASADHPAFRTTVTFNTADGTQDYATANDFRRIIEPSLKFTAAPKWTLTWLDQQEWDRVHGDQVVSSTARPYHYTIRHRDATTGLFWLRLWPVPGEILNMSYDYFAIPADISTAADGQALDVRFPAEFHRALWVGMAAQFPQYLDRDQLQVYRADYAQAKRDLRRHATTVVGKQKFLKPYRPASRGRTSITTGLTATDLLDGQGNSV